MLFQKPCRPIRTLFKGLFLFSYTEILKGCYYSETHQPFPLLYHHNLILASQSPRRSHLLGQLGIPFTVHPSHFEEIIPSTITFPPEIVSYFALQKAISVASHYPDHITLGADTIVVIDDEILGKPADDQEAQRMLGRLSGRTHMVYTGLALVLPATAQEVVTHEATRVTFDVLTDNEISAYVATGSPLDKAGAYGIQDDLGAIFVARIEGDYYNVVGLPLNRLYRTLKAHFPDFPIL